MTGRTLVAALLALLLSLPALAAEQRTLSWDLSVDGKIVGKRNLTVKWIDSGEGPVRMLEGWTELEAAALGMTYAYQQRVTGFADHEPASFHSVISEQGHGREVQGRRDGPNWVITTVGDGRSRTLNLPRTRVDISTVDLIDPESRTSLDRFDTVRILSAETGDIVEGKVVRLGPSSVALGGVTVPVEGLELQTADGNGRFYYSQNGWLVRFETRLLGRTIAGTLREPPPRGVDEEPISEVGAGIQGEEL